MRFDQNKEHILVEHSMMDNLRVFAGLTEPTAMCDAGYVCVSGSNSSSPVDGVTGFICLVGHYCPAGSGQGTKCPLGTFSNTQGLHNSSSCEKCTPGKYCNVEGR
jgi:hypothetical protein